MPCKVWRLLATYWANWTQNCGKKEYWHVIFFGRNKDFAIGQRWGNKFGGVQVFWVIGGLPGGNFKRPWGHYTERKYPIKTKNGADHFGGPAIG